MRSRRGLTLIELLVVLVIMVALFAIVAAVGPHFGERQRTNRGASQLQGWILVAKQRALRDFAPRGIRLIPPSGPPNAQYVTQLQYIEQPDPYQPYVLSSGIPTPVSLTLDQTTFSRVTLQFSSPAYLATALEALWPTPERASAPDVILEYYGRYPGQPRRVINFTSSGTTLTVALDQKFEPNPPLATNNPITSTEYRFYRKAQPIAGEPVLQMPRDVAIDISRDQLNATNPSWYRTFPAFNTGGGGSFDILFDQTGQVIGGTGRLRNRICLWVRDVSLGDPGPDKLPPGDNVLITVYTRSGQIAAHPVDDGINPLTNLPCLTPGQTTWNPFYFTQDGKSSGM
jgi:prepilin-type N-terminal cleavage/methylation domain-containing protein